jgi:membrane associated rhomboid family serine protease
MIGPSQSVLITMGSRYVPCMRATHGVQDQPLYVPSFVCPNSTTNLATSPMNMCTLSEACGFGGVPNPKVGGTLKETPQPNQWFRFILPMFLHAGVIHIGFNMLLQMTLGKDIEKLIGSLRFALVYFCSGIFGFVLGGNYAGDALNST